MAKEETDERKDFTGQENSEPQVHGGAESEREQMSSLLHDDSDSVQHLRDMLSALHADGSWFRRQKMLLLLLAFFMLVLVSSGYQAQQEILDEAQLGDSVKDWRNRCLTREGELTRRTRQSELERQLKAMGDSTLVPCGEPPFLLTDK